MPLINHLLNIPFLEKWIPDRLKPVPLDIVSDQYSQTLIKETEIFIEDIIQLSETEKTNRIFKRKSKEYKLSLKIRKKRMKLDISDQKGAMSPIKKRVIIDLYRKIYKTKNGVGKIVDATIYYSYQGTNFVRTIKQSSPFHGIFYKLDMLDDAMIGRLMKDSSQPFDRISTNHSTLDNKNEEVLKLMLELKRITTHAEKLTLDPIIERKLNSIISQIDPIIPDYHLLEIEDRHVIKRMLKDDLPQLLHSFFSLTLTQQLEQKEKVYVALSRIELKLISLIRDLEKMRLEKIEHLLRLNEVRYDQKKSD